MALRQQKRALTIAVTLEVSSLRTLLLLLVLLASQWLVLNHSADHLFHKASAVCQLFVQAEQPCGGVSNLGADLFLLPALFLYLLPLRTPLFPSALTHSFSARAPPPVL